LAAFVIVTEEQALGTEAESTAGSIDAGMRAAGIVFRALVHVLASAIVGRQFIARNVAAAALVTARHIVAYPLAWAVTAIRCALVDICKRKFIRSVDP
jgi:hypothetical protein